MKPANNLDPSVGGLSGVVNWLKGQWVRTPEGTKVKAVVLFALIGLVCAALAISLVEKHLLQTHSLSEDRPVNPPEVLVERQGGGIGGIIKHSAARDKALQAAERTTDTWRAKVSNALTATTTKGLHKVAEALHPLVQNLPVTTNCDDINLYAIALAFVALEDPYHISHLPLNGAAHQAEGCAQAAATVYGVVVLEAVVRFPPALEEADRSAALLAKEIAFTSEPELPFTLLLYAEAWTGTRGIFAKRVVDAWGMMKDHPSMPGLLPTLASAYVHVGNTKEARRVLQMAIETDTEPDVGDSFLSVAPQEYAGLPAAELWCSGAAWIAVGDFETGRSRLLQAMKMSRDRTPAVLEFERLSKELLTLPEPEVRRWLVQIYGLPS